MLQENNIIGNAINNSMAVSDRLAGTLSCRDLEQRKANLFAELNKKRVSKTELANGYSYEFVLEEATESQITLFIKNEKECCRFFEFDLKKDSDAKSLRLNIEGPIGVKAFINKHIDI